MRYFIHIRLGRKLYEDRDGCEFPSLEAAREEAVQAVRVLLRDQELADLPEEQSFDIQDVGGRTMMVVPFSDAFPLNCATLRMRFGLSRQLSDETATIVIF